MTTYEEFLKKEVSRKLFEALENIGEEYPDVDDEKLKKLFDEGYRNFIKEYFNM